jgi:hypothetical protein
VIDRGDVHRTCMGGPQWFEEDFDDEGDEVEDEEIDAEEEEGIAAQQEVVAGQAGVKALAAKATGHVTTEEARKQVREVVMDWVVETVRAEAAQRPG